MGAEHASGNSTTGPEASGENRRSGKNKTTPPKGRPTRKRDGDYRRRRAFGPVSQWIAVVLVLLLLFVVMVIATGGGDFNPFNDDDGVDGASSERAHSELSSSPSSSMSQPMNAATLAAWRA